MHHKPCFIGSIGKWRESHAETQTFIRTWAGSGNVIEVGIFSPRKVGFLSPLWTKVADIFGQICPQMAKKTKKCQPKFNFRTLNMWDEFSMICCLPGNDRTRWRRCRCPSSCPRRTRRPPSCPSCPSATSAHRSRWGRHRLGYSHRPPYSWCHPRITVWGSGWWHWKSIDRHFLGTLSRCYL